MCIYIYMRIYTSTYDMFECQIIAIATRLHPYNRPRAMPHLQLIPKSLKDLVKCLVELGSLLSRLPGKQVEKMPHLDGIIFNAVFEKDIYFTRHKKRRTFWLVQSFVWMFTKRRPLMHRKTWKVQIRYYILLFMAYIFTHMSTFEIN